MKRSHDTFASFRVLFSLALVSFFWDNGRVFVRFIFSLFGLFLISGTGGSLLIVAWGVGEVC